MCTTLHLKLHLRTCNSSVQLGIFFLMIIGCRAMPGQSAITSSRNRSASQQGTRLQSVEGSCGLHDTHAGRLLETGCLI